MSEIPRRNDDTKLYTAEQSIKKAVTAVENVGAHPLLTDAIILLVQAFDKVADYYDTDPKHVIGRAQAAAETDAKRKLLRELDERSITPQGLHIANAGVSQAIEEEEKNLRLLHDWKA